MMIQFLWQFGEAEADEDEGEEGPNPNACPWCMQVFSNLVTLQSHIKTHVANGSYKPYICHYCNVS
jgi:hypothetical protein